ncbi:MULTISPECIES: phenylacetic acid degradation bifunctional protein PaaZ [Rhodobacterales]|jgi:oxepin-CoA hydrolase/3-oxo-5,6-dehydrosuberyl-CoA semialdehyde dehydrogenase|uniref:phenylacetic acid degradation bifunctional protein PaaZ n=1 Tax=Rhodobacterales TaxID=204455 RepID=UPI00237F20B5|nr:phenylacetic acid degradation bifunctional protein PaaZ [Phaeobacter gallaeciensis]MDE4140596.1 phenylacetic acid degradation bifunctional protein PaaZ [Phaeobacter gallaeciensis]MDE4148711.1 phenylacetic acid degradation bifunctional protein PaaZ [Phaeobacter gallaeciensis]MDE4152933.1 phenylacetic acid degradation bifunctional protein PaaZ [Phaeobacter gallaeciensis]MDE4228653.1 phenylacetic acid degradation bifunctional protein PaaZ [Phaeobacter gallaeciensis]MDE4257729.1 phenylacetic ac
MSLLEISSYAAGDWVKPGAGARNIASAVTGATIASAGNDDLDVQAMLDHARKVGGPALRKLTFHDRARMLKALATELGKHKDALYDLSFHTGATQSDHMIDIDGGIGTMFVFASKGRREMPDGHVYLDGDVEQLSRTGSFLGQHICTPLQGVAVHINAFNFPVWGMLEKLAPTLLAGVPAIVKPATATCYVTELAVKIMLDSGILPEGALQLVSGGIGDMLDRLDCQDVVSFTGSANTALKLRNTPAIVENSVRFVAEQDSLNASILGPDAAPGTPEFDLFIKEVSREMTAKAGQKCTAVRRIIAPEAQVQAVIEALSARLAKVVIGDPRLETTRMGALVSGSQKRDVLEKAALIGTEAKRVFGDPENFAVEGADAEQGAFVPPMLFHCEDPDTAVHVHDTEAFGPVSTVMGYRDLDHAIALANRGQGSLVASVITHDPAVARAVALGSGAFHGRLYFNNRDSMKESTGHGSPLPHMVHGGPGRAGGGEELGGVRGVKHYMQRTAIQGSPDILSAIGDKWVPGGTEIAAPAHPFTRKYGELSIGETLHTAPRTVTLEDIEHFAHFTGDTFYAHMDDAAAKRNPFFPGRVAHGYLLLSFAAGLFVQPDEGPVLANTGLDGLRFMKPVSAGDSIKVRLTVKKKTPRNEEYGEVRWHVTLTNQDDELVAEYELLTMNAF